MYSKDLSKGLDQESKIVGRKRKRTDDPCLEHNLFNGIKFEVQNHATTSSSNVSKLPSGDQSHSPNKLEENKSNGGGHHTTKIFNNNKITI